MEVVVTDILLSLLKRWLAGIRAGDLWLTLAAWVVLLEIHLHLDTRLFRWEKSIATITGFDPFRTQQYVTVTTDSPTEYTTANLKEVEQYHTTRRQTIGRRAFKSVLVSPTLEEVLCRGIPLVLATTVTGHPFVVLLLANVVWAHIHVVVGRSRHTLPYVISGLLYVYLWVHGLGLLAIGLHAWNNLVAIALETVEEMWSRYDSRLFAAGEEYVVTVKNPAVRTGKDLLQAKTADGRLLKVPDVEPGDVCRVRVATNGGWSGHAYPIERFDSHPGRLDEDQ